MGLCQLFSWNVMLRWWYNISSIYVVQSRAEKITSFFLEVMLLVVLFSDAHFAVVWHWLSSWGFRHYLFSQRLLLIFPIVFFMTHYFCLSIELCIHPHLILFLFCQFLICKIDLNFNFVLPSFISLTYLINVFCIQHPCCWCKHRIELNPIVIIFCLVELPGKQFAELCPCHIIITILLGSVFLAYDTDWKCCLVMLFFLKAFPSCSSFLK